MTSGLLLATHKSKEVVREIAGKIGFKCEDMKYLSGDPLFPNLTSYWSPEHKHVDKLSIQIHPPSYFSGIEGVITEIEFDDSSERFPNNPEAMEVLKKLYKEIPGLQYIENQPQYKSQKEKMILKPLSAFLEQY